MQMCKILSIRRSTEVGKSSLLTALTGVQSEAAAYEFTTLTCIPGWNIYGGISSRTEIKQLVLYGHAMPCFRLRYTAFPKSAKYLHHSVCIMFPFWTYDLSLSLDAWYISGVINYNDCKIQLLDLPGIISGAAQGKGGCPA